MSLAELPPPHFTTYRPLIEAPSSATSRSSVSGSAFRRALSQLAAGTSIVTMRDQDGHKLGLTATAVTSVSLDPPLVLVCVNSRTRTAAAMQTAVPFIIHFLAAGQEALARHFASPIADKFAEVAHHITPSGCPQIEGVLASVECVPYQRYPGGDHIIVIGRVVEIQLTSEATSPLIYFRNQFLNQH